MTFLQELVATRLMTGADGLPFLFFSFSLRSPMVMNKNTATIYQDMLGTDSRMYGKN
jgi:hypothetical protein